MSRETHEQILTRMTRSGQTGSHPVAAATVVLLRDGNDGLETLMLRRNSRIAFGGMWVFPGGRVDATDCLGLAQDDDLAAARVAAVREAREETALTLSPNDLVPLSHWTPPSSAPRRFLTWFFLARAPAGAVQIDDGEIHEHAWLRPRQALQERDAGNIELAPPTFVTLHDLARHPNVDSALAVAGGRDPEFFATVIAVDDEGPTALWHGDAGYDNSDTSASGARHRLSMRPDQWQYERS